MIVVKLGTRIVEFGLRLADVGMNLVFLGARVLDIGVGLFQGIVPNDDSDDEVVCRQLQDK